MRKLNWLYGIAALAILLVLAGAAYRLPPIHDRLSWRVDFAMVKLRGLVRPIQAMPTALPEPEVEVASMPTATPLPAATPTSTLIPTPEHTPTSQPSPTPLPPAVSLPAPEWEKQDINNCGPAALTMHLRFYGWEGDQETITEIIKPFREDRNVNVEELAYYVRNYAGWLNVQYRVGGDLELLKKLLSAGIPVMIEETFYFDEPFWANDDLWAAHYQLVTGYDDAKKIFIGQDSFHGANQEIPYQRLDEYWQAFNRLFIVVYQPGQEATVQAILGDNWDPDVNRQHALKAAEAETQADPDNAFAWFNLGANLSYFERYIEATDAFDKARELGLPQRMLRYQFSPFIAYFHTGQIDDLIALSEYALEVTPNSEEALLWHGWAMYRKGDTSQAVENFQQALVENPNYLDAQYALDFVRGN
jgi:tetratricopeptide (TPR) repeat protein